MANIFADIGRSTAFQTGQGIFRDVMATGELERRTMYDAVNMKHQQDIAVIAKQKEAREEAEYQRKNRPTLLSDLVGRGSERGRSETMKLFKEAAIMSGAQKITLPDGSEDYTITEHDLPRVEKFMSMSKELRPQILYAQLKDNRNTLAELEKQLPKAKEASDIEGITSQIDKIKQANGDILSELRGPKADTNVEKVIGPDGKPMIVPREMSVGMTPYVSDLDNKKLGLAEDRLAETERHNRASERATDARMRQIEQKIAAGKDLSFADKEALRGLGKQLPKTKVAAQTAEKNVLKIDRMLNLIDQGAGGVRGELLAKINKTADVFRVTPPEDAKYNTLKAELRGFAGQLRLQLGLVGQTSDRDVAIMYESAGGNSPAESQKAIIEGYRQGYVQDITNYNSDAEAYTKHSEVSRDTYKPIKVPERKVGAGVPSKSFTTEAEAADAAAKGIIKPGDKVIVGGQSGTWR